MKEISGVCTIGRKRSEDWRKDLLELLCLALVMLAMVMYNAGYFKGGITGLAVGETNQEPVFVYEGNLTLNANESKSFDLSLFFEDNDNLTYLTNNPDNLNAYVDYQQLTLEPAPGFVGKSSVKIYASDGVNTVASPEIEVFVLGLPEEITINTEALADVNISVHESVNLSTSEPALNLTESNETLVSQENITEVNFTEVNESLVAQNATVNLTEINITLIENVTPIGNVTLVENISDEFVSIASFEEEAPYVEIGKPVKWIKLVVVENKEDKKKTVSAQVDLPEYAENISVVDPKEYREISKHDIIIERKGSKLVLPEKKANSITGMVLESADNTGLIARFLRWLFSSQITGAVTGGVKGDIVIHFKDYLEGKERKEYLVEYYTEAPEVIEAVSGSTRKVTVFSKIPYENIHTYTDIADSAAVSVRLEWYANRADYFKYIRGEDAGTLVALGDVYRVDVTNHPLFDVNLIDSNRDNNIDRIEWITPHLSNQSFEVSIVSLTVLSDQTVEENWTVRFSTTGAADLEISGYNGTSLEDLEFSGLWCGDTEVNWTINQSSAYVKDWNCSGEARVVSRILNNEKHSFGFRFGELVDFAYRSMPGAWRVVDEFTRCNGYLCNFVSSAPHFTSSAKFSFRDGKINISYKGTSLTFAPFFVYNGNTYTWEQSKTFMANNNIKFEVVHYDFGSHFKYALNFTNIPDDVKNKINYIGLRVVDAKNLNYNDVEINNQSKSIKIKDRFVLSYADLVDSGYSVRLYNKTVILIGNVAGKNTLWLDPSISAGATHDTYINLDNTTTNYDDAGNVRVGYKYKRRGLFIFDISSLPAAATVSSAILRLYTEGWSGATASIDIGAHEVTSNWDETQATWVNRLTATAWGTQGGDFNSTAESTRTVNTVLQWWTWNITKMCKHWIATNNYGVLLYHPGTLDTDTFYFSDHEGASYHPELNITYRLQLNGEACTYGGDCQSGICVDTDSTCGGSATCQNANVTFGGRCCSDDGSNAWTADGSIARDSAGTYTCDEDEVAYNTNYYNDCKDVANASACDSAASGGYTADGVCAWDEGGTGVDNYDCDTGEVCDDTGTPATGLRTDCSLCDAGDGCEDDGETSFTAAGICLSDNSCDEAGHACVDSGDSNNYKLSCSACGVSTAEKNRCDVITDGAYSASGVCTDADTCTTGALYDDEGTLKADCSAGTDVDPCDSSAADGYAAGGICNSDSTCDAEDVANNSGVYYACDGDVDGLECDTDTSNGDYGLDAMCLSDSNDGGSWDCKIGGEACNDGTYYEDDCASCAEKDECDVVVAAGDFSADGVCVTEISGCCNNWTSGASDDPDQCDTEANVCDADNGDYCDDVSDGSWDAGTTAGTDEYRCDQSDSKCRLCEADNTENNHTSSTGADGTCESGCGAAAMCDESAPNSTLVQCAGTGATYYADMCGSTCGAADNTSVCKSAAYDASCDADAACNNLAASANTGACDSAGETYFEDQCDATCSSVDDSSVCRSSGFDGSCTGDANAENKAPSGCDGTSGWINTTCGYYNDGDSNADTCGCLPDQTAGDNGIDWNLGSGNVSDTTCCGDDASEWSLNMLVDEASIDNSIADNSSDVACCGVVIGSCVYQGDCYSNNTKLDVDGDGDTDWCYVGSPGEWYDCNDTSDCPSGYTCNETNDCENQPPTVSSVVLSTPTGNNMTTENLSVTFSQSDPEGYAVTNITDWRLDGTSIAVLNMPFDTNVTSTATGAVKDYSTYENNGTLEGTDSQVPLWITNGKVGGAYLFSHPKNQRIIVADSVNLRPSAFTAEAWVQVLNFSVSRGIISKINRSLGTKYCGYGIGHGGTNKFVMMLGKCTDSAGFTYTYSDTTYLDTDWHHVVGVYDGTKGMLYVDGVKQADEDTMDLVHTSDDLIIGRWYTDFGGLYFNGTIDDVRIYNRSLSAQQILANYNAGLANHAPQIIVSQETVLYDNWTVAVTPNDATQDGITVVSNQLTIINGPPTVSSVVLSTPTGKNMTIEDLSVTFSQSDPDNDATTNITDWRLGGTSIAVLNMPFDTNTSSTAVGAVKDYSTYENNGTLSNAAWTEQGLVGGAYYFDGTAYLNVTISGSLCDFGTGPFTISFWMNTTDTAGQPFDFRPITTNVFQAQTLAGSPEYLMFRTVTTGTHLYTNKNVVDGNWHHIVLGRNSTNRYIFVDGVFNVSDTVIDHNLADYTHVYLGAEDGTGTFLEGSIDEFIVFGRGLSGAEIAELYNAQATAHGLYTMAAEETSLDDVWTVAITPNDATQDGTTVVSNGLTIRNDIPTVSAVDVKPDSPTTNSNLTCNATVVDSENTTLTVQWFWYNGTDLVYTGNKTGVANNSNSLITTLNATNTSKDEVWNCTVRADDGTNYSAYLSEAVTIGNTLPPKVTLLEPTNMDYLVTERFTYFNWSDVADGDGEPVSYHVWVSLTEEFTDQTINITSVVDSEYTSANELDFATYWWKVRANDSDGYGEWSDVWNFTIVTSPSVLLTTNTVDFIDLQIGEENDTADFSPAPFAVMNDGNCEVNVSINASALWSSGYAPLDTQYYQFKANYSTEANSFDYAHSQTDWLNLSEVLKSGIAILNHTDANDLAYVDIRIEAPLDEPGVQKSSSVVFLAEDT
ncbi:MAG: LamG-like jellyroll fold domain-containing protein [Candidatus Woesearchaeota archaeon]